ncbi:GH32 C-terminal domain-containing protein [Vibrio sp. WXL103]|uniref:GH32 C-terminal domain-containing protein n=1 Tax=Vibrio sp. WXL103 TaxID=3450710 RepID=UPI003EC8255F
MTEKYRPLIHMTPDLGWMNDPNGLVYFNGLFHQFYQYYPNDTVWGPMHWGHKVSKNLLDWQELEPALYPDEAGMCFSGSALVDWNNTSGLFEADQPGLLAFYTSFIQPTHELLDGTRVETPIQQQSLAYSQDGISWKKYADGAPIIPARGNPDFRDPKVFWHQESQAYVMVVSCGQHIEFYRSTNLLDWNLTSEFGYRHGAHSQGPWECPDLFELTLEGCEERYWVLVVGIGEGAHCGGAGTQYFIGQFDGQRFTNLNSPEKTLWLDFGRDYYATQSFSDIPVEDGRRIVSTWMSNHQYSLQLPTQAFRSSMAMPRELFLFRSGDGLRVGQRWVKELSSALSMDCSDALSCDQPAIELSSHTSVMLINATVSLADTQTLRIDLYRDSSAQFEFRCHDGGLEVRSVRQGQFGAEQIDQHFPHDYWVLLPVHGQFELSLLFDRGSVELLINHGQFSLTNLVYPDETQATATFTTDKGTLPVCQLSTHTLTREEPC